MNNYKGPGDVLTLTAPSGGVVSGTPYLIGALLVVATATVAEGEEFQGKRSGVFDTMPKATSQTWDEGAILYWDDGAEKFTTTAGENTPVGCAAAAAGSSDTTGTVLLSGVPAAPIET